MRSLLFIGCFTLVACGGAPPPAPSTDGGADLMPSADLAPCVAETDGELCQSLQVSCGAAGAKDRCGKSRVLDCGQCVTCDASFVQSCATQYCGDLITAANNCTIGCGEFNPDPACTAQNCTGALAAVSACVVQSCAPCDLVGLCSVYCQSSGCITITVDECTTACIYYDAINGAACASVLDASCNEDFVCGQLPPNRCGANQFACASDQTCVPISKRCDTTPDCPDGSDEATVCPEVSCAAGQRRCGGSCVSCPSALGVACEDSVCEIGSCASGAPNGNQCVDVASSVLVPPVQRAIGTVLGAIGSDGSRHIVFPYVDLSDSATQTVQEWDYLGAGPSSGWSAIETLAVPAGVNAAQLLLDEQDRPIVIGWDGSSNLWHATRDDAGWHTDSFRPSPSPTPTYAGNFSAGWNPLTHELVVVEPALRATLHRAGAAWSIVSWPATLNPQQGVSSNLVFDASGTISFLAGTGNTIYFCQIGDSNSCATALNSYALIATSPILSVDSAGARFTVADEGHSTQPLWLIDDRSGSWTMTQLGFLPNPASNVTPQLSGDSGDRPIIGELSGMSFAVDRWTGSDWQAATVTAPQSVQSYRLISRGSRWLLATISVDATSTISATTHFELDVYEN